MKLRSKKYTDDLLEMEAYLLVGELTRITYVTERKQVNGVTPVSYTHLDVYKRQAYLCADVVCRDRRRKLSLIHI